MTTSTRLLNPVLPQDRGGPDTARPRLHPLELALVGVTSLHLCFLPWAFGAMHSWSQLISLGLAGAGFVLSVLPRTKNDAFASSSGTEWPAARLIRFPVFWASLILLGYMAVQALNPAWTYQREGNDWWLEPADPVSWLPSGVAAPFEISNPWRMLIVFASLALLISSVWTGFLRRQSYRVLFTVLAINAGLLGLLGVFQRLGETALIYWTYPSSNSSFIASFIYPNHAGPYFNLMVALAVGLAWWQYERSLRRVSHAAASRLLVVLGAFTGLLVILSYSRMSIMLLLGFVLLSGVALALRFFRRDGPIVARAEFMPLLLVVAGLAGFCLAAINTPTVWKRFSGLLSNPAATARGRGLIREATTEMWQDRFLYGWGAGCFRYTFTKYAKAYPEISGSGPDQRMYWEHAHNDVLEFPAELGLLGMLPLLGMLGYAARALVRLHFWRNPVSLSIVFGCALVLVHAWVDFVFQNPAVLLTWGVLLTGAVRWLDLDRPGGHRAPPLS